MVVRGPPQAGGFFSSSLAVFAAPNVAAGSAREAILMPEAGLELRRRVNSAIDTAIMLPVAFANDASFSLKPNCRNGSGESGLWWL
jgi:hypothetical protein